MTGQPTCDQCSGANRDKAAALSIRVKRAVVSTKRAYQQHRVMQQVAESRLVTTSSEIKKSREGAGGRPELRLVPAEQR